MDTRAYLITDLTMLLYPFGADYRLRTTIVPYLNQYSDELLHSLVGLFDGKTEHAAPIKTSVAQRRPEATIREHLEFFPLMPDYSQLFRSSMVKGLRSYRQLPETDDLTSMGPQLISQCKALIMTALAVDDRAVFVDGRTTAGFADDRLVNLIIAHANDAEQLVSLITERGTADPALISEILNAATPALSEGTL